MNQANEQANTPQTSSKIAPLKITFLALCLLLFFSTLCQGESFSLRGYHNGDLLPSFTSSSITNKSQLTFSAKSDSPTLIIFFSLRPLFRQKRSLTLINDVRQLIDNEFAGKVRLTLVFSDNQEKKNLRMLINDGVIPPPVYDDSDLAIYNKFGVFMAPIVVLIAADGTLHEVLPTTYNIKQLLRNNIKLLLGEWTHEEFKNSFKPKYSKKWTKKEKQYLRHINYGKIMYSRKMYSPAIREFATAAKIAPDAMEAQIGLGKVYLKTKKYPKAIAAFKRALKNNAESNAALAGLGVSYFQMGDSSKAVKVLEDALISDDPDIDAIIALAQIYEARGNIVKAMRLNKMAVFKLQNRVD